MTPFFTKNGAEIFEALLTGSRLIFTICKSASSADNHRAQSSWPNANAMRGREVEVFFVRTMQRHDQRTAGRAHERAQPRGTGWRSVNVYRGAPRPQRCLGQSVTGALRGSVLVKLRDYPDKHSIPDSSCIAIYVISTDVIQGSYGSLATEQR